MIKYLLSFVAVILFVSEISAGQFEDIPLEKLIPVSQQNLMGIQKLTPQEKENLRIYLINTYLKGFNSDREEASKAIMSHDVILSQIDGDFEGWGGETIVKLMNGQIWQQLDYYYTYHYAFMPDVVIYRSGSGYKMGVEGVDKAVSVIQLR